MKNKISLIALLFFTIGYVSAQETKEIRDKKHRVSVVLGHSYLNLGFELGNKDVLSIPSFGLDYEYWF